MTRLSRAASNRALRPWRCLGFPSRGQSDFSCILSRTRGPQLICLFIFARIEVRRSPFYPYRFSSFPSLVRKDFSRSTPVLNPRRAAHLTCFTSYCCFLQAGLEDSSSSYLQSEQSGMFRRGKLWLSLILANMRIKC